MKLKRLISSALALGMAISSFSAVNVFAADPYVEIGAPIDALTGEAVTELTPGQGIEVPVDIHTDTGSATSSVVQIWFDTDVFDAGIDITEGDGTTLGDQYYEKYTSRLAVPPTNENQALARNNLSGRSRGDLSVGHSLQANEGRMVSMAWGNITPITMNANDYDFYFAFTVRDDYDPDNYGLNGGNNGLNTVGGKEAVGKLFGVDQSKTTIGVQNNDTNVAVTQDALKNFAANGCLTAFQVDVDNDQVAKTGYWIQRLYAKVGNVEQDLSVYNNEDGSATYSFPARVVTDSQSAVANGVEIYAEVSKEQNATETQTVLIGGIEGLTTDSTVTDYGTPTTITSVPVE